MDPSKKMYVLCGNAMEWEDTVIFLLTASEAVEVSKKYPKCRLERFELSEKSGGYEPTYHYYQDGMFHGN